MRDQCFSHGTPYGHEHGWDTLATQCGRSTRHPTRQLSTVPAPPRPGTATVPRRPCTAPHSRVSTVRIAHQRHRHTPSGEHHKALANDGRIDAHKHAATASGARQHAGHAGHQSRAARTQNPCPPACCSPICLQRRSTGSPASAERLVSAREDEGEDGSPTLVVAQEVE